MDDPREEPGHELASSAPAGVPQQPYAELYQLPSRPQATRRSPSHPQSSSTFEKDEDETFSRPAGVHGPLPPVPHARLPGSDGRIPQLQPVDSRLSGGPRSGIDWIVPVNEKVTTRLFYFGYHKLYLFCPLATTTSLSRGAPSAHT